MVCGFSQRGPLTLQSSLLSHLRQTKALVAARTPEHHYEDKSRTNYFPGEVGGEKATKYHLI